MDTKWWQTFFDDDYLYVWGQALPEQRSELEAKGLWEMLELQEGSRVLDAPCGYGRISRPLAVRGAHVLGLDLSETLLKRAEAERGDIGEESLRYCLHNLVEPLPESDFDAALNVFSSLGYGSGEQDRRILGNLCAALKPGGLLVVETNHRDAVVVALSRTDTVALRLPDGTLVYEEPRFDPLEGRIDTTWYWSGPGGSGQKSASLRVYCITELVALIREAGMELVGAFSGCSTVPFKVEGDEAGGRVALLARRT